jgi:hypothetical protein
VDLGQCIDGQCKESIVLATESMELLTINMLMVYQNGQRVVRYVQKVRRVGID